MPGSFTWGRSKVKQNIEIQLLYINKLAVQNVWPFHRLDYSLTYWPHSVVYSLTYWYHSVVYSTVWPTDLILWFTVGCQLLSSLLHVAKVSGGPELMKLLLLGRGPVDKYGIYICHMELYPSVQKMHILPTKHMTLIITLTLTWPVFIS